MAFNIALLPSIKATHKPKLATSIMAAVFLVPEVIVFLSLSLWYSFTMAFINMLLWSTLAWQRCRQIRSQSQM